MSSLYDAVMRQKIDDVRRIIEENPNSVNQVFIDRFDYDKKRTPIFAAVYYASRFVTGLDENILDLLIESGANVNKMDTYGFNVLHLAAVELNHVSISENKVNSVISKLINAGADVMTTNNDGFIPLQEAVEQNNEYVVYALLKNSSEELRQRQLNATNPDGQSAMDIAEDMENEIMIDILRGSNSTNNGVLNTSFNNTTDLTDLSTPQVVPERSSQNSNRFVYETPEQSPRRVNTNAPWRPAMESQPRDFHQNANNEMSGENNSQSSQSSMISRWSEKDIYKKVQDMQNKSRYPINITKDILFNDPIMLSEETINIAEYIAEDKDNIVLKYGNEKYFFTNRSTIEKMYQDDASIFYGCYSADTALFPREVNVSRGKKYLSLKSIGLIGPNNYCIMNLLLDNTIQQIFYVKNLDYTFESYASEAVLNGGNVVSALHCQAGHKSAISTIVPAYPSIKDYVSDNNNSTITTVTSSQNSSQNSSKNSSQNTPSFISFWGSNTSQNNASQNSQNNSSITGGKIKKSSKKSKTLKHNKKQKQNKTHITHKKMQKKAQLTRKSNKNKQNKKQGTKKNN